MHAGLRYFNLGATSLVILNYGSWSIAWGIKQGIFVAVPNMCGNEFENAGTAWIGG